MIDTAIKHFIYEICIDTIFLAVRKNFVKPKIPLPTFRIGDFYKYIEMLDFNNVTGKFYDITITDIEIECNQIGFDADHGVIEKPNGDVDTIQGNHVGYLDWITEWIR
jgi:hypothetical protein